MIRAPDAHAVMQAAMGPITVVTFSTVTVEISVVAMIVARCARPGMAAYGAPAPLKSRLSP